jgi:hypothetical protein
MDDIVPMDLSKKLIKIIIKIEIRELENSQVGQILIYLSNHTRGNQLIRPPFAANVLCSEVQNGDYCLFPTLAPFAHSQL